MAAFCFIISARLLPTQLTSTSIPQSKTFLGNRGGVYKSRTRHLKFIFVLLDSSSEDRQVTMSDHGKKINVFPAEPVAIPCRKCQFWEG